MNCPPSLVSFLFGLLVLAGCQPRAGNERASSRFPLRYSLGSIDPRFGIGREQFLTLIRRAERTWEEPLGLVLFEYDPTSDFTVNLVFDHRQQRTLDARAAKTGLDERERSIRSLMEEYNAHSNREASLRQTYEDRLASFTRRLELYNRMVADWNRKGGAPQEEFARLNEEKRSIETYRAELDKALNELNTAMDRLNSLAEAINDIAREYNLDVALFNGRYVESREFEQGAFDGRQITVHQFNDESDLTVALIHEFGHALGFQHVDSPEAIMYRRLGQQNLQDIRLTKGDLDLLKEKFDH